MSIDASALRDLEWRVSRTCDGGQCIKVARTAESIIVGSTVHPAGPFSEFTVDEWRHFVAGIKLGDFDGIA